MGDGWGVCCQFTLQWPARTVPWLSTFFSNLTSPLLLSLFSFLLLLSHHSPLYLFLSIYLFLLCLLFTRTQGPSGDTCWGALHISSLVISAILLIFYLPICVRLIGVDGKLSNIAVYSWFDWSQVRTPNRDR